MPRYSILKSQHQFQYSLSAHSLRCLNTFYCLDSLISTIYWCNRLLHVALLFLQLRRGVSTHPLNQALNLLPPSSVTCHSHLNFYQLLSMNICYLKHEDLLVHLLLISLLLILKHSILSNNLVGCHHMGTCHSNLLAI